MTTNSLQRNSQTDRVPDCQVSVFVINFNNSVFSSTIQSRTPCTETNRKMLILKVSVLTLCIIQSNLGLDIFYPFYIQIITITTKISIKYQNPAYNIFFQLKDLWQNMEMVFSSTTKYWSQEMIYALYNWWNQFPKD